MRMTLLVISLISRPYIYYLSINMCLCNLETSAHTAAEQQESREKGSLVRGLTLPSNRVPTETKHKVCYCCSVQPVPHTHTHTHTHDRSGIKLSLGRGTVMLEQLFALHVIAPRQRQVSYC